MSARCHWSGKTFAAAAAVAVTITMAGAQQNGGAQTGAGAGPAQGPRTAQTPPPAINWPAPPPPDGPIALETAEEHNVRIVVTKGLSHPWGMAFHQHIRDVRQGPDGYLYVLTEKTAAALLRFEPGPAPAK